MLFESHITVEKPITQEIRDVLESIAKKHHWKTSEIDRDPVMGKKAFFYFTSYDKTKEALFDRMKKVCDDLCDNDVVVLREKIEHIVYDTKINLS